MVRRKTWAWIMVGVGVLALGGTVAASAGLGEAPGKLWQTPLGKLVTGNLGRWMTLRSEINLTAQQRSKIRDVALAHRAELAPLVQEAYAKRVDLRKAVLAEQADEAAIRKAAEELGKSLGNVAVAGAKLAGEVRPVLTAEQLKLLRECLTQNDGSVERFLTQATASP